MREISRRQFGLAAFGMCAGVRRSSGQDEAKFSADVKVVNVLAAVHAKSGRIVRDLGKDDFTVVENGRPQIIRYFARETDLPLTLGLLIDTSESQRRVMDAERGASSRFLDQVMREDKDKVFLMQFDTGVQVRTDLTSSWKKLEDALSYVDTVTRKELREEGGGTALYDAIVQASRDFMQKQGNRKALIVLTDGVDVGSQTSIGDAIEAAQRADTLIYSIEFSDPSAYSFVPLGGPNGRKVLMRLSAETGGGYYEVTKKQSIDRIYALIQEELRSQYNLGFLSDVPARFTQFRKLQVGTTHKDLIVQSRNGYWAQK